MTVFGFKVVFALLWLIFGCWVVWPMTRDKITKMGHEFVNSRDEFVLRLFCTLFWPVPVGMYLYIRLNESTKKNRRR